MTRDAELAARMRLMSLHGLSQDAWDRYTGKRQLGLSDPRARLQVQPDRHRGRDRHPPARSRRRHAPGARSDRARVPASGWRDVEEIELPPTTRTGFTRGTCFRSGCDSKPWRSIGTASFRNCTRRGVVFGALAAAASPSLLRADVRLASRRSPGRVGGVDASRQPAAVFRHAAGRNRCRRGRVEPSARARRGRLQRATMECDEHGDCRCGARVMRNVRCAY